MAYRFKEQKQHYRFRQPPKTEAEAQQRQYDYSVQRLADWQARRERGDYINAKEIADYRDALDAYVQSRDYFDFASRMTEKQQAAENRRITSMLDDFRRAEEADKQKVGPGKLTLAQSTAAWEKLRNADQTGKAMRDSFAQTQAARVRIAAREEADKRQRLGVTDESNATSLYKQASELEDTAKTIAGPWMHDPIKDAAWLRQTANQRVTLEDTASIENDIAEIDKQLSALEAQHQPIRSRKWNQSDQETEQAYQKKRGALLQRKKALEAEYKTTNDALREKQYQAVTEKENFAEKSQYEGEPIVYKAQSGTPKISDVYVAVNGFGQGKGSQYNRMTTDEVGIFNYLYNTGQKDEAERYIEWLTPQLNQRNTEDLQVDTANFAAKGPLEAAAASAGTALIAPFKAAGYIEDVINTVSGKDIDVNSPAHSFSNVTGAVRGQVRQDIKEATDGFFLNKYAEKIEIDNIGAFGYDTVMSMADNLVNMAVAGGTTSAIGFSGEAASRAASLISSVLMGSQVAADATIEAKQHGDSDEQAVMMGFIRGAIEGITEKYSLDSILKNPKSLLGNAIEHDMLRGFVSEGFEEVASNLLNAMVDAVVYSDEKSLRAAIDKYIAEGQSEWEAFGSVLYDALKENIPAFLAGGYSGMAMSGIGNGMGLIYNAPQDSARRRSVGEQVRRSGNLNTILGEADVSGDRRAQHIGERVQEQAASENISARQQRKIDKNLGRLYDRLVDAKQKQAIIEGKDNFRSLVEQTLERDDIAQALQERGSSTKEATYLIYKAMYTGLTTSEVRSLEKIGGTRTLTSVFKTVLNSNDFAGKSSRITDAALRSYESTLQLTRKKLSKAETEAFTAVANSMSDESVLAMIDAYQNTKGIDPGLFAQEWRLAYQYGIAGVEQGGDRIAAEKFTIYPEQVEMARSLGAFFSAEEKAAQAIAQIEENETVELGTLEIRDNYGLSDEGTRVIEQHWSGDLGITPHVYNQAAAAAYRAGRIGDTAALEGKSVQALPADVRQVIYAAGEKYSRDEAAGRQAKTENSKSNRERRGSGKVEYRGVSREALSKTQRVQTEAVEAMLASGAGINVTFFKSKKNAAGISIGDSGRYDPNTNTIYIDVNAGKSVIQDSIIFTASHELTHWMREQAPVKFQEFAQFLMEEYGKNNVPIDQLIQEKIKEYGGDLSYMDAYEEVVAESCQEFLRDSEAKDKLMKRASKDRSLIQRIGEYIQGLLERMLQAVRQWKAEGPEAQYMRQLSQESITQLQQRWRDLLMEGVDSNRTMESSKIHRQTRSRGREYSYTELTSKPDMIVTQLSSVSANELSKYKGDYNLFAKDMRAIAMREGNAKNTSAATYLYCDDLDSDVLITRESFKHGAARMDETYISVCKSIAPILKNSIVVNELSPRNGNAGSYVLIGISENADSYVIVRSTVEKKSWKLTDYNELYAIRKKSIEKADVGPRPPHYIQKNGYGSSATIKIADFLGLVKDKFDDTFTKDVYAHLQMDRKDTSFSKGLMYQQRGQTMAEEMKAFQIIREKHEALRTGTEMLNELLQYQRENGKEARYTQQSILTMAGILKKHFGLNLKKMEIAPVLNRVYEQIAQSKKLTEEELDGLLTAAAQDIGVQAEHKPKRAQYADLVLRDIRKSKVVLNAEQREAAAHISGSYESYRKSLFGSVTLTNDGISLDSIWQEWAQKYPGTFDADVSPNDQPQALQEAIRVSKEAYEYSVTMDEADFVDTLARAIYDGYWRVTALKEVRGKYQKDINRLRSLHMQMMDKVNADEQSMQDIQKLYREMIRDIRKDRDTRLQEYKAHMRETRKKETERRLKTVEWNRMKRSYDDLLRMLQHPTQKKHVPEKMVLGVAGVLKVIDMDKVNADERVASYEDRIAKESDPAKVSALMLTQARIREQGERLQAAIMQLRDYLDSLKNDKEYYAAYDEDVCEMLDNVRKQIPLTSIANMSSAELRIVADALAAVQKIIRRSLGISEREQNRSAYERAEKMIKETRSIGKTKAGPINRYINAQARPKTMFERLGNFTKNSEWMEQYNLLNQGQLKATQIRMEANQRFAHLISDEKNLRTLSDTRNRVNIGFKDVRGNSVTITRGTMLSVYMHMQNEDNARHMLVGGLRTPNWDKYYKVSTKDAYGPGSIRVLGEYAELVRLTDSLDTKLDLFERETDAYRLTELQEEIQDLRKQIRPLEAQWKMDRLKLIDKIEPLLTDYEKEWIRTAQEFFDVYCKDKLVQTTLAVYGFKRPMVKHYFPILTDPNFNKKSNEGSVKQDRSLENIGMMHERVQASNPILLEDITAVIQRQINSVADYCGIMPAVKSFNQIFSKSETRYQDSLRNAVAEAFGESGTKYIDNLTADLQGARRNEPGIFDIARGNLAAATLTLNPRVAMAQAASFPTAAAVLGWKAVNKALVKGGKNNWILSRADTELIAKYSPLLYYRMQGYSDIAVGDIKSINQAQNRVDKKLKFLTGWIQAIDGATVGRLWYAAEYYVQDHFCGGENGLKKGTDAYYKKVAEWFNKVVEETQPNYTTMQRPDILRNPNALVRQLTMFLTQRQQNMNIMYESVKRLERYRDDYKHKRNGVTQADVKEAWQGVIRAVSSQTVAGVTIVSMKMLSDAFLRGLLSYKDDDDELTLKSLSLGALDLFTDTMISNIIGGSEFYSLVKSIAGKNRWYGININGVDALAHALDAVVKTGTHIFDGEFQLDDLHNLAKTICRTLGLPLENAEKLVAGMMNLAGNIVTVESPKNFWTGKASKNFKYDMNLNEWINKIFIEKNLSPRIKKDKQNANTLYRAIMDKDQGTIDSITASYKDQEDFNDLIKSGLKKNDTRIVQAAQARLRGDSAEYSRIAEKIAADGFEKKLVIETITSMQKTFKSKIEKSAAARTEGKEKAYHEAVDELVDMGFERQLINDYTDNTPSEKEEDQFDGESGVIQIYNADDVYINLENGDTQEAQDCINSIYEAKLEQGLLRGKTEEQARSYARSSLKSSLRAKYKQQYINGDAEERERILDLLTQLIAGWDVLYTSEDIVKWEE